MRRGSYTEELLSTTVQTNIRLNPPTVSPMDPVSIVVDMMIDEDVGAVVVVDEDRPEGIITEKDVLERVIEPQKNFELTLARDVMSKPLITIEAECPIEEALDLMRRHNIRRLVVTENGAILGLVTERRLLELAHEHHVMRSYNMDKSFPINYINRISVAFISTYPPRECGIATYTKDLVDAISGLHVLKPPFVIAINDRGCYYNYGSEVVFQIARERVESYVEAARYINGSDIDVVNLQHEFGLFGGVWGGHIVSLLEELEKPVITTLHSVLMEPVPEARKVHEEILRHSDYVVVMARVGLKILEQLYETLSDKVRYIPHGCPNVPFIGSETVKRGMGLEGRIVLSTFGLLSQGKGIEYAIQALPPIVKEEPRITYLIIGETHPEVRKQEGELYRKKLIDLVDMLGLEENVRFVNRFLTKNELLRYLQTTDTYILPYPNKEQISSGTLLYALSTGKAIVSTPFLHAEEVIQDGCAMGCEFKNPDSITDCIKTLLQYDHIHKRLGERAYEYSRDMIWPNVAMRYANLFYEALGFET